MVRWRMKMANLNGLMTRCTEEVLRMGSYMVQGRLHSRMDRRCKANGKMVRIFGLTLRTVEEQAQFVALNYIDRFEQPEIRII